MKFILKAVEEDGFGNYDESLGVTTREFSAIHISHVHENISMFLAGCGYMDMYREYCDELANKEPDEATQCLFEESYNDDPKDLDWPFPPTTEKKFVPDEVCTWPNCVKSNN